MLLNKSQLTAKHCNAFIYNLLGVQYDNFLQTSDTFHFQKETTIDEYFKKDYSEKNILESKRWFGEKRRKLFLTASDKV